ncbi:MAG: polymer-forming cytoskeletal protein [Candidatus Binatia bacterium]
MTERWQQRRGMPPRPAAPKPIPARAPEAGIIGWREIRTVLDQGTQVNGKLSFTAPTRIEGRLRGEVRASDLLEIAACGVVHGSIWAKTLIVAGEVRGQVLGADRVEILEGGRVHGLIETRALVVVEGAIFEGDLRMNREDAAAELDQPARG